ncbi:sensor histidine kinase [Corynebacterium heidelbergense]|uniref:Uncharacterized protein n=1 Tax=Corynebacterium heidelbergense TaxID=2055947 RepID=A0A364V562_9CORY|nr:sensor histidine kinase [Corynebacterium heidelbergense]RAV31767.1 hypothetical protein DLJ54_06640 [Corynebacterium heidelbergense]
MGSWRGKLPHISAERMWQFSGPVGGLSFMAFPVLATVHLAPSGATLALGLSILAAFSAVYVYGFSRSTRNRTALFSLAILTVLSALALAQYLLLGPALLGLLYFIAIWALIELRWPWAVLVALTCIAVMYTQAGPDYALPLLVVLLMMIIYRISADYYRKMRDLDLQQTLLADRERVGQDLHDSLGQSLTALSLRLQVAARLTETDPAAAKREILECGDLTRGSLEDMRSTVAGLRTASLPQEIADARATLSHSRIRLKVSGDYHHIDPRLQTPMAWVLRESVTNVIRHSGATSCTVSFGPQSLEIRDDGRGRAPQSSARQDGFGIPGMRERVQSTGGNLSIQSDSGGFSVTATWSSAP